MYELENPDFVAGALFMFMIVCCAVIILTIRDKIHQKHNKALYDKLMKPRTNKAVRVQKHKTSFNPFKAKYHQKLDNTYDYINQCWDEIDRPKRK